MIKTVPKGHAGQLGPPAWRSQQTNGPPPPFPDGGRDYHMFRACTSSEDESCGDVEMRDGPRCAQAAAGPCFAPAKRSVIYAVFVRVNGHLAFAALTREDIKLSAAAFRLGILGVRASVTPRLSGSITLSRWSHRFSIVVAPMGSRKKAFCSRLALVNNCGSP